MAWLEVWTSTSSASWTGNIVRDGPIHIRSSSTTTPTSHAWIPAPSSEPPSVCSILAALNIRSIWPCYISSFISLFSFNDIKLNLLTISNTSKVFSWVVFYNGRLVDKYILFGVISVYESITALDVEPLHSSANIRCDNFLFLLFFFLLL